MHVNIYFCFWRSCFIQQTIFTSNLSYVIPTCKTWNIPIKMLYKSLRVLCASFWQKIKWYSYILKCQREKLGSSIFVMFYTREPFFLHFPLSSLHPRLIINNIMKTRCYVSHSSWNKFFETLLNSFTVLSYLWIFS